MDEWRISGPHVVERPQHPRITMCRTTPWSIGKYAARRPRVNSSRRQSGSRDLFDSIFGDLRSFRPTSCVADDPHENEFTCRSHFTE